MIRFRKDDGSDYPEWEQKAFGDIFTMHQTNTFSRDQLNNELGDVQNIHYGDILVKFGSVIDCNMDKLPFVNEDVPIKKFINESYVRDGDIIVADTAEDYTAGKVSEVQNIGERKVLSGLHTMLCRPQKEFASRYLGYYLNSEQYHKQVIRLLVGTKVYSINKKAITDTILKYPCLEEQQKIADFLSSVDDVIAASEQEITTLEEQKKGVMQKIFSQEVRFKADDGSDYPEWEEKLLKEVALFFNGDRSNRYPKDNDFVENGICFLNTENLHDTVLNIKAKCKYITIEKYNELSGAKIELLDTIYCLRGSVGLCALNTFLNEGTVASSLMVIRAKKEMLEPVYMNCLLKSNIVLKQVSQCLNGSCAGNLSAKDVGLFLIPIPCLEEQQKIADFLSDFDTAIDLAKQELEQWKELKKGLLQQLFE